MVELPIGVYLLSIVGPMMLAAILGLLVGGACRVAGEADECEMRGQRVLLAPREEE